MSGVQAFIDLSIIAILSHALWRQNRDAISLCNKFKPVVNVFVLVLTLAGVWDRSVLTELEEEQWDPVFVSVPDKRRFLDSGELDICASTHTLLRTGHMRNNKLALVSF